MLAPLARLLPTDPPEKYRLIETALASNAKARRLAMILLADKIPLLLTAIVLLAAAVTLTYAR